MTGVRGATVNIVATATIAPLAGVLTLGDFIINENVYGDDGVLAGAIVVALLALVFEFGLGGAAAAAHLEGPEVAAPSPDLVQTQLVHTPTRRQPVRINHTRLRVAAGSGCSRWR